MGIGLVIDVVGKEALQYCLAVCREVLHLRLYRPYATAVLLYEYCTWCHTM